MSTRRTFVCASANAHKVAEMQAMLNGLVELVPRPPDIADVDEVGDTLVDNAILKAVAVSAHVGHAALADDTGLEVDALNGEPGVRSARYAGEPADDARNRTKLLDALHGAPDRSARFRTVLAIADTDGSVVCIEGECEGTIATEQRGSNGFGYDSVFIPRDGDGRTFAEMTADEKNSISHRSRAIDALRLYLLSPQRR